MAASSLADVSVQGVEKRRNPSKHYEYVLFVTWSTGAVTIIYRRYNQFYKLHTSLLEQFPKEAGNHSPNSRTLPFLPGKVIFGRSAVHKVAIKRLQPLDEYCKLLVNLPTHISQSEPVIRFFQTEETDIEHSLKQTRSDRKMSLEADGLGLPQQITGPIQTENYTIIADFTKEDWDQLDLHQGETVEVVDKNPSGWWLVSSDDGQGWVPSSYLERTDGVQDESEVIKFDPGKEEKFVVTMQYDPQFTDEVHLNAGTVVEVVEKNLNGWWRVRAGGQEGLAPATNMKRADTVKARTALDKSFAGNFGGKDTVKALTALDESIAEHLDETVDDEEENFAAKLDQQLKKKKPIPLPKGKKSEPEEAEAHQPLERTESNTSDYEPVWDDVTELRENQPMRKMSRPPPRKQSIKIRPGKLTPMRQNSLNKTFTVMQDFTPTGPGLPIKRGQRLKVLEKSTNGWWFAQTRSDGRQGWVPMSFLQEITTTPPPSPDVLDVDTVVPLQPDDEDENHEYENDLSGWTTTSSSSSAQSATSDMSSSSASSTSTSPSSRNKIDTKPWTKSNTPAKPLTPKANIHNVKQQPVPAKAAEKKPERKMTIAEAQQKGYPVYKSRMAFSGGELNETDLDQHEVVPVLQKEGNGWWYVQSKAGAGWVPSHFLKAFDPSKDMESRNQNNANNTNIVNSNKPQPKPKPLVLPKVNYREVTDRTHVKSDNPIRHSTTDGQGGIYEENLRSVNDLKSMFSKR